MSQLSAKLGGFTIAELLITLLIVGEIATFTIPKVLTSQQNTSYKAKAKEAISMISGAYQMYQMKNGAPNSDTTPGALTQYMNYVRISTSSADSVDWEQTAWYGAATTTNPILFLHSGATILVQNDTSFGGTNTTNALIFSIDPDGRVTDSTTDGPGKAVQIFLFYNGRIGSRGMMASSATSSDGIRSIDASKDPSWFSW